MAYTGGKQADLYMNFTSQVSRSQDPPTSNNPPFNQHTTTQSKQ